jgi:trehalose-6-phosphate synthase
MLVASALSRLHEAVCVHPHDEGTVEQYLDEALSDARTRRLARKGA